MSALRGLFNLIPYLYNGFFRGYFYTDQRKEVNRIIKSHDHDLNFIEKITVREMLTMDNIFQAYKGFFINDTDRDLQKQADAVFEKMKKMDAGAARELFSIYVGIIGARRRDDFNRYLVTQPINKIIQIHRKIYRENKDVAPRLAATYKEMGIEYTKEEELAAGMYKLLIRKKLNRMSAAWDAKRKEDEENKVAS